MLAELSYMHCSSACNFKYLEVHEVEQNPVSWQKNIKSLHKRALEWILGAAQQFCVDISIYCSEPADFSCISYAHCSAHLKVQIERISNRSGNCSTREIFPLTCLWQSADFALFAAPRRIVGWCPLFNQLTNEHLVPSGIIRHRSLHLEDP